MIVSVFPVLYSGVYKAVVTYSEMKDEFPNLCPRKHLQKWIDEIIGVMKQDFFLKKV